jgi:hypothetical protein
MTCFKSHKVWTKTELHNDWQHASVAVSYASQYLVVLRADWGIYNRGVLAVDDIVVHNGTCPIDNLCTFEDVSLCGYLNDKTFSSFSWIRGNSSVIDKTNVGPYNDASFSLVLKDGHFSRNNH